MSPGLSVLDSRTVCGIGVGCQPLGDRSVVRHDKTAVDVMPLGDRLGGVSELILGGFGVVSLVDLRGHRPTERVGRDIAECGETSRSAAMSAYSSSWRMCHSRLWTGEIVRLDDRAALDRLPRKGTSCVMFGRHPRPGGEESARADRDERGTCQVPREQHHPQAEVAGTIRLNGLVRGPR